MAFMDIVVADVVEDAGSGEEGRIGVGGEDITLHIEN